MIQGQQSFAQQQDKVALCEWRYKHSLTSLQCYKYVSKTKQLQETVIVGHAVANVSLTVMTLPLADFHLFQFVDCSQFFEIICAFPAIVTVHGWMSTSSATSIKNKHEELKNFEHLILFSVFTTVIPIFLPV